MVSLFVGQLCIFLHVSLLFLVGLRVVNIPFGRLIGLLVKDTKVALPLLLSVRVGYILSWELSNTMDTTFCIDALEKALDVSTPEIESQQLTLATNTNGFILWLYPLSLEFNRTR
jgi:hypothetical protein